MSDKPFYGGDGHLSCAEASVADQLPMDFRSGDTGIFRFQVSNLHLKILIKLSADAFIFSALWHQPKA